jgi:hypothetical protein
MEEKTSVDNDYKEAFNQGYMISQELGLKPEILEGLSAGKNRMQAMQDGMKQYQKDLLEKSKGKDIIPPLDLDEFDHLPNLDTKEPSKDKSPEKNKGIEPDV